MKRRVKLLSVLFIALCVLSACESSDVETIDWENLYLGKMLPAPSSNKMEISCNDEELLDVYINKISMNDFLAYTNQCEANGFNVEADRSGSSGFEAYNNEGYSLQLYYDEEEDVLNIMLEAPKQLDSLEWPANIIDFLPAPTSNVGRIEWNDESSFFVTVGETSIDTCKKYIAMCREHGFSTNAYEDEDSFSAENTNGYELNVRYIGFNTMEISVWYPDNSAEIDDEESDELIPNGMLELPCSDFDYWWTDYNEIVEDFTEAGFTNIKTVPLADLTDDDWFTSENEYDEITIAGESSFSEGDIHPADVEIIITYHSYADYQTGDDTPAEVPKDTESNATTEEIESIKITVQKNASEFKGMHYEEAAEIFKSWGFTNIVCESSSYNYDNKPALTVSSVSLEWFIFSESEFKVGDTFDSDYKVRITYYEEEEPEEEIVALNVDSCTDLATLVKLKDPCDPFVKTFASQYSGRYIEFDGAIYAMQNHGDYSTRFDILINPCDFDENSCSGPNFRFTDVNANDLDISTLFLEDVLWVGRNVRVIAKVGSYNADTSLFELDPVSITVRD